MKLESQFKKDFKAKLRRRTLGHNLIILDTSTIRSFPDTLILGAGPTWAALEFKRERKSAKQPNQDYYVALLGEMGYSAKVYPEVEREVLDDLAKLFTS